MVETGPTKPINGSRGIFPRIVMLSMFKYVTSKFYTIRAVSFAAISPYVRKPKQQKVVDTISDGSIWAKMKRLYGQKSIALTL